jgi:uncharacterized protein
MTCHFAGMSALLCAVLVAAAPTSPVPIDIAALARPANAATTMPPLARQLLAGGVPDAMTRIRLDVVAGDLPEAQALLARLPPLDAVRMHTDLANRNPFGSWDDGLEKFKGRKSLSVDEAIELTADYAPEVPAAGSLIREDQRRRFLIQRVSIATGDGATIAAIVVRARGGASRTPAALIFTIYAQPDDDTIGAEYGAARGYATAVAYTRGKAWSSGPIAPYENDGRDADRVISWIARQSWSDGQVGMYSGSYNGYTQWAAAKYGNPALKTIVPYVANNPGNGLPMENNIFLFVNYPWIYYVTDNRYLDDAAYAAPVSRSMNDRWYASGVSYRDVPRFYGRSNPWLQKWLDHPSFDAYWQSLVPYERDFARINIPVLTITGYYDDGQGSALNFLKDHYRYNPYANHYLVIGPYDHLGSQRGHKPDPLRGYALDPVAQFSTPQLTFDWFDWIMRHRSRPGLLANRINYEVMGANMWRHAATIDAMAAKRERFYLAPKALVSLPPQTRSFMQQTVNFADRKTVNGADYYPFPIIGAKPDLSRGLVFISQPFDRDTEISGFFTGVLQAIVNKRDLDVEAVLYQQLPDGRLMHLSYFMGRASYGDHIDERRLLTPGKLETIPFDRSRLVSRLMQKGSRLLLVVDVVKNGFAEINYGTGKDVSREDIRDARIPLVVQWATTSYIEVPIR